MPMGHLNLETGLAGLVVGLLVSVLLITALTAAQQPPE